MGIRNSHAVDGEIAGRSGLAGPVVAWVQRLFRGGFAVLGKAGCERRLKLVETLQLGGKRQLMLVLCDGQPVLVGAGGDSIQAIVEIRHQPQGSDQEAACQ
jgi:hypothetical protein